MYRFQMTMCLCLSFLTSYGQDFRSYDLGDLAYEDFRGAVLELDNTIGEIYFDYKVNYAPLELDGINTEYEQLQVGVNTEQSWIDITQSSKLLLDYFQVVFDIEHLASLRYNNETLMSITKGIPGNFEKIMTDKEIMISKFRTESEGGTKEAIVRKWGDRLEEQISTMSTIDIPDLILVYKAAYDIHLGYAYNLSSAEIKETFGNRHGIGMGLNFDYKGNALILSGAFGFKKLEQTLVDRPFWEEKINVNSFLVNLAYGRKLRLKRFMLTPFLGAALHDVYIDQEEFRGVYADLRDVKWNIGGGMFIDIPIFSKLHVANRYSLVEKSMVEQGVRLAVHYIAPIDHFGGRYSGNNLSFSVNYYFRFGSVGFKKK